jgi:hypothetical protein
LQDLIWLGLIGMTDPIREGMEELIHLFHQAGDQDRHDHRRSERHRYAIGKQLNLSGDEPLQILTRPVWRSLDPAPRGRTGSESKRIRTGEPRQQTGNCAGAATGRQRGGDDR